MRFPFTYTRAVALALAFGVLSLIVFIGIVYVCDRVIEATARDYSFSDVQEVPFNRVALVLGCSEILSNGRQNLYFKYRIEAAAELYRSGRCHYLLVSGDNSSDDYDEPTSMKDALIKEGVPAKRIYTDYAGFRTLDSVVRAAAVFGEEQLTVVSQRFHNERAIYIAREKGIRAVGYDAADVTKYVGFKTRVREKLARVKTFLDIRILGTKPKFLGPQIRIDENAKA